MAQKIVSITLIPTGGLEADRVTLAASDVILGGTKSNKTNNVLKVGEKSYKLDSLLWDIADIVI